MKAPTQNPVLKARLEKGWSQEKLARECEVSRETIRSIEQGGTPQVRIALRVAQALGRTLDELFGEYVA